MTSAGRTADAIDPSITARIKAGRPNCHLDVGGLLRIMPVIDREDRVLRHGTVHGHVHVIVRWCEAVFSGKSNESSRRQMLADKVGSCVSALKTTGMQDENCGMS